MIGVWAESGSLAHPERDVAFARELGCGALYIMVNDHSKRRGPTAYTTRAPARIVRLAEHARAAGLEAHLTSWVMPHAGYLAGLGRLRQLAEDAGAASVLLDAEEPWTRARGGLPYSDAAVEVARQLDGIRWGVTGIGYASWDALGVLVTLARYAVPQAYATATSGVTPERAAAMVNRWRQLWPHVPLIAGLAAYRQIGIAGHTAESAMRTAYDGVREAGCADVIYWSLRHLRASRTVAGFVRGLGA